MTRLVAALLVALAVAAPSLADTSTAVAAALADARGVGAAGASTRYLSLSAVPVAQRKELRAAVAFWVNSLSKEPIIVQPRLVGAEVLALDLHDYGMDAQTWDRFAQVDPYYTVRVVTIWPGGVWTDGRSYAKGSFSLTSTEPARWLDQLAMAELYQRTASRAPLLRADWFLAQVAIQADRKVGYYDLLGVGKKRADFEKLVGMDRAAAVRVKKEVAAIVDTSIVTLHNRHIYRFQTLLGAYWETRDAVKNEDVSNALRLLNGDFKHNAEEVVASLPNGMFAFWLGNAAGDRADTAPDNIASDGLSTSTDRRVHPGLSCVRCHSDGLRSIDCWFRRVYAPPDQFFVAAPLRALRFRQLYQSDIGRLIERDKGDYAESLKRANGLLPGDNAKIVASVWSLYNDQPITVDVAARECGVTVEKFVAAIRAVPIPDPILFALAKQPSIPARREHWEESFILAMTGLFAEAK